MHFNETVTKERIQISSVCVTHFENMMRLIENYEHYPVIVTQKLIDTSRSAEKIVIRSREETLVKEWQYKYEQVYAELNSWR